MSRSLAVLPAVALALALAGCAEPHVYDQDAHRRALEEHGVSVTGNMDSITAAMESACDSQDPVMWTVGFLAEGGDPEVLRIGIEHVCPERGGEFDEALG